MLDKVSGKPCTTSEKPDPLKPRSESAIEKKTYNAFLLATLSRDLSSPPIGAHKIPPTQFDPRNPPLPDDE